MVGLASAEDGKNETQSVVIEVTDENKVKEIERASETSIEKSHKTNVTQQKNRSIKMIIGGQSEDGQAKQVTLPVKD